MTAPKPTTEPSLRASLATLGMVLLASIVLGVFLPVQDGPVVRTLLLGSVLLIVVGGLLVLMHAIDQHKHRSSAPSAPPAMQTAPEPEPVLTPEQLLDTVPELKRVFSGKLEAGTPLSSHDVQMIRQYAERKRSRQVVAR